MRSAKNPVSPGRGRKFRISALTVWNRRGTSARTSLIGAPCEHQNSSASLLITQSALKSVAASRAMRETHSICCMFSPSSRMRWR